MNQRAYTVDEIDDLRNLCETKWLFGEFFPPPPRSSAGYQQQDKDFGVEQLVRTYMLAGLTADDIRAASGGSYRPVEAPLG